MHIIKTGEDRIVIVFPQLGFVLKVARFGFCILLQSFKRMRKSKSANRRKYFVVDIRSTCSAFHKALGENLRERKVWKNTKSIFLVPTWFSFFGLVNIMAYAKKVLTDDEYYGSDLLMQISYYSGFSWCVNLHAFENGSNFCIDEFGKVKMLDYGFKKSEEFIANWGQKLYDSIEPTGANTSKEFLDFKAKTGELRLQKIFEAKAWMQGNVDNTNRDAY